MKNIYKAGIVFLLFIILTLYFLPLLAKNYIVKNSKTLIGTEFAIEKLEYNYFTSTVKLYGFKLYDVESSNVFVSLNLLELNIEPLKLLSKTVEVEECIASNLSVNIKLKEEVFNFDRFISGFSTEQDNTEQQTESYQYIFNNITIVNSKFDFENQDLNSNLNLVNINAISPSVYIDKDKSTQLKIDFNLKQGGSLNGSLNVNLSNGVFNTSLKTKNFNIAPFYGYLQDYAIVNSLQGELDSDIKIKGNFYNPYLVDVSGKANVLDFEMTDVLDKKLLAARSVSCLVDCINYGKEYYKIDSISFNEPYAHFSLDTVSNNVFRTFKLYPEENIVSLDSVKQDSVSKLYYAINHLQIDGGVLDYSDIHTGDLFEYHLSDLHVDSDSIISNAKRTSVKSDMILNNRGTLNANFNFDPSDYMNSTLDFRIENFLLSDINIYSNYYMGHNVLEGDFYYYSHSELVNGEINSENKLLVKNVTVKSQKKGLYKLPLKLALFLLKDSHGDVNLDIPVKGDLNDPKVNIGRLVWRTFKNLIIKVVASPFRFVSGLVDGDHPKEMEQLKFTYLDTILSNQHKNKLDKLLSLEKKKDKLKIKLDYVVNPEKEITKLSNHKLATFFKEKTGKNSREYSDEFIDFTCNEWGVNHFDKAMDSVTKTFKLDSVARYYDDCRIKKVKQYLKLKNDFTQIKVNKNDGISSQKDLEAGFLIDYTLE